MKPLMLFAQNYSLCLIVQVSQLAFDYKFNIKTEAIHFIDI